MKDQALRDSILITAQMWGTRGDHDGDLICNVLKAILQGAKTMDEAYALEAPKPRKQRSRT